MRPLVVIPARGGSKGLPGKNIKDLGGKPLIWYTIEAARKLFNESIICVSTDSHKIKEVVEDIGLIVPFLRPIELASDTANSQDVLLHALEYFKNNENYIADTVILLQVTSPFRSAAHITEALQIYNPGVDMVASVKETDANPYYILKEESSEGFLTGSKQGNFTRRQDCPKVYELNGAIYIMNVASLKNQKINEFTKVKKYLMSKEDSVDIDDYLDWAVAQAIIKRKNKL